jgi:hypothetical protein
MVRSEDGVYWDDGDRCRIEGKRYTRRSEAVSMLRARRRASDNHTWRLIHVRIRPRSERLYLAARLAAWEPVVRAAIEFIGVGAMLDNGWGYLHALGDAVRALPKEHRP